MCAAGRRSLLAAAAVTPKSQESPDGCSSRAVHIEHIAARLPPPAGQLTPLRPAGRQKVDHGSHRGQQQSQGARTHGRHVSLSRATTQRLPVDQPCPMQRVAVKRGRSTATGPGRKQAPHRRASHYDWPVCHPSFRPFPSIKLTRIYCGGLPSLVHRDRACRSFGCPAGIVIDDPP